VFVRHIKQEERTTASGIVLSATVNDDTVNRGIVVAVGPGVFNEKGVRVPMEVAVGDNVFYRRTPKYVEVVLDGETLIVVAEMHIYGKAVEENTVQVQASLCLAGLYRAEDMLYEYLGDKIEDATIGEICEWLDYASGTGKIDPTLALLSKHPATKVYHGVDLAVPRGGLVAVAGVGPGWKPGLEKLEVITPEEAEKRLREVAGLDAQDGGVL